MNDTIMEIQHLKKYFKVKGGRQLHAVDDINLSIERCETLGLVGESGCGKSTIGRVIVGLYSPTDGDVKFLGKSIYNSKGQMRKEIRHNIQMIFQDPYSSLNPRKTIKSILAEPFIVNKIAKGAILNERIEELINITGLSKDVLSKYPHELDGGKRQTVGIARSLVLNPEFIVCDEPVSALDVSIQAQTINLMMDLQDKMNLTYLFISHDLSVVRHLSKHIAVMYLGKIVELAEKDELFTNPIHPYTRALLSAVPTIQAGRKSDRIILSGDVPTPIDPKPGCRFYARCWLAKPICLETEPTMINIGNEHFISCNVT